ncbi:MAG: hypothetical protein GTN59_11470, partial [Candidatus Dadabacteria bacterium]|nr:hypothetical protein [Candidatus Dadabacteria bacterium]
KYFPKEEEEDDLHIKDYDLEKWVTFPSEEVAQGEMEFNPDFDENTFMDSDEMTDVVEKVQQVTLHEFLYERCTLEIFGYADEIPGAMDVVNNLIIDNKNDEFIIMSRELGLSIPSTFFFLSKTSCMCQNIKFVTDSSHHWKHVDVMVTDHPDIINSKPFGKYCIIVDRDYNKAVMQPGVRISTIHELPETLLKLNQEIS